MSRSFYYSDSRYDARVDSISETVSDIERKDGAEARRARREGAQARSGRARCAARPLPAKRDDAP
ncbi:hypothetical protein ACX83E_27420, partial [Burkholderia pseudomallei]